MGFCDQCGKEMRDGAKFCDSCGAASGGGSEQSAVKQPSVAPVAACPSNSKTGGKRLKFILIAVVVVIGCCAVFWKHVPGLNTFIYKRRAPEGFAYIPPGQFMMGSPESEKERGMDPDEEKQHKVNLTKGFYMKKTEVTQGEWEEIMGNNPSNFKDCGKECPVERVSWYDAREFIEKYNAKHGGGFRLPTEAEWEYAARAGTTTAFYTGDIKGDGKESALDRAGWCGKYSDKKTYPVANKEPNDWGLYDMLGNVWEWVNDRYGDYSSNFVIDPIGSTKGMARVVRGGSWSYGVGSCRAASRSGYSPDYSSFDLGFRLVRTLP
jgi:formylglycine-generating enzyme required for sulfatase activity